MKALSLKQPWAELILQGKKTIETRKWKTHFRGTFLIHASLRPNIEEMNEFGFSALPTGCIVGMAELIDVIEYSTKELFDKDIDNHLVHLSNWTKKRYGFILKNVQRTKPISVKGQLNFFDVTIKDPQRKTTVQTD